MKNVENLDQQYLQKLKNIEFQPVFILGLHRSGTSILYKMMTATQCLNSVTAYHLINYNKLLHNYIHKEENYARKELTNFFIKHNQADRGIDRLKITSDFAEEYGFLLGQKSNQMYITSKNLSFFIELAKKIQFISENDKPILFKNPFDMSNYIYIKKVFPNAKFIFIHRHPYKTLSSLFKAVKLIYKKRNPYTTLLYKDYNKTFENPLMLYLSRFSFSSYSPFGMIYLTLFSSKHLKYYMKNIQKLSKKDYISISYEELCNHPQETMQKLIGFLKIKSKKIDYSSFIKPRKTSLDSSVVKLQKFIYTNMKDYFKNFEYESDVTKL